MPISEVDFIKSLRIDYSERPEPLPLIVVQISEFVLGRLGYPEMGLSLEVIINKYNSRRYDRNRSRAQLINPRWTDGWDVNYEPIAHIAKEADLRCNVYTACGTSNIHGWSEPQHRKIIKFKKCERCIELAGTMAPGTNLITGDEQPKEKPVQKVKKDESPYVYWSGSVISGTFAYTSNSATIER